MLAGIIWACIAGSLVGLQNVFNNKVNARAGLWATTALVLGMGFTASFTLGLVFEGAGLFQLSGMRPWHWFSGMIGVGVVICLVQGTKLLGPTYAVSIVMASQLGFALLFDTQGWLGLTKLPFTFNQLLGVLVIIGGIFIFKSGGRLRLHNAAQSDTQKTRAGEQYEQNH